MWRLIAKPLDRIAIRSACGSVLPSPDGDHHAAEAIQFLEHPDFFSPPIPSTNVELKRKDIVEFESPFPGGPECNNRVRGRLYRGGREWQRCPSVILLHGWNAELQYQWQFPFLGELLAWAGVNAVMFELPYHVTRRPRDPGVIRNFLSGNLLHVMQATHQALADVRALAQWLRRAGSPTVGLWGVSLGGWLAGLALAHQPEIDFAVLLTPVVRMDRALRELAFCDPIREQLRGFDHEFARLNLVTHPPPAPPRSCLVVASQLDLFAPTDTIEELERHWEIEVWRFAHGHISILLSTRIMRRIVKWVRVRTAQPLVIHQKITNH